MASEREFEQFDAEAFQRAVEAIAVFARAVSEAVAVLVDAVARWGERVMSALIEAAREFGQNLRKMVAEAEAELRAQGAVWFGAYGDDGQGWREEWIRTAGPPGAEHDEATGLWMVPILDPCRLN